MSEFGGRYDEIPKEFLSPADVNKERPRIKQFTGKDENDENQYKYMDYIYGILYKIETSEFEWKGKKLIKIKYYLTNKEAKSAAIFTCGMHTNYNRDFLNRLSNLDEIDDVKFLLWNSYWEEKDKNITRGSVHKKDESGNYKKIENRFPYEDIPAIEYVEVGDKTVPNDKEIKEFFNNVLEKHVLPKLKFNSLQEVKNHFTPGQKEEPAKDFDPDEAGDGFEPDPAELEEDELPF